jgi:hypothetical protein
VSYQIAGYEFQGPFTDEWEILDQRGVFVVLSSVGGEWKVLDVDASGQARTSISHHTRKASWERRCYSGRLAYAIYYCLARSDAEMNSIVDDVMRSESPPCHYG